MNLCKKVTEKKPGNKNFGKKFTYFLKSLDKMSLDIKS